MEDVSTLGACLEKMGAFRPFLLLYENGLLSVLKRKEKVDLYDMGERNGTITSKQALNAGTRAEGSPGDRFRARVKYGISPFRKYNDTRKSWHFLWLNCANISGCSCNGQVLPYYNTAHYSLRVETESRVSRHDRLTLDPSALENSTLL